MLSVGRELNISDKPFACLTCAWEGVGAELSTRLVLANDGALQVYAYRCPVCNSFKVNRKGKLLPFRELSPTHEESQETATSTFVHLCLLKAKEKFCNDNKDQTSSTH